MAGTCVELADVRVNAHESGRAKGLAQVSAAHSAGSLRARYFAAILQRRRASSSRCAESAKIVWLRAFATQCSLLARMSAGATSLSATYSGVKPDTCTFRSRRLGALAAMSPPGGDIRMDDSAGAAAVNVLRIVLRWIAKKRLTIALLASILSASIHKGNGRPVTRP